MSIKSNMQEHQFIALNALPKEIDHEHAEH